MKRDTKIEYDSYSVIVTEEDLNPFRECVNREMKVNFAPIPYTTYSTKYDEEKIHVLPKMDRYNSR